MIKHKLMQVMKERDDQKRLKGMIQLDDAYWGGRRRGGKSGRGSPGKTAFVAAVEVIEQLPPEGGGFRVPTESRAWDLKSTA